MDVLAPLCEILGSSWSRTDLRLHHLLFHTSGLRDEVILSHVKDSADLMGYAAEIAAELVPGRAFIYCNANYTILAAALEKLAGAPIGEVLTNDVFRPAGMPLASLDATGAEIRSYRRQGDRSWRPDSIRPTVPGPEGIFLSMEDLRSWLDALEGDVFDPADRILFDRPGMLDDGTPLQYGFGQFLFVKGEECRYVHLARDGGLSAVVLRELGSGDGAIAMTNGDCPDLLERCVSLFDARATGQS